jgi:hypothetical protein
MSKHEIIIFKFRPVLKFERSYYIMANYRQQMNTVNPRNVRDAASSRNMLDNVTLEISNSNKYKIDSIDNMPLAMAYVPWQQWKTVYDLNKALAIGTIFPELDLPFLGMRGDNS